jgi:hypothetical protein
MTLNWYFWICLRFTFWLLWLAIAFPIRLVEHVVVGFVGYHLRDMVREAPYSFVAFLTLGLVLSHGIFQPLSNMDLFTSGTVCVSFLSTMSWLLSQVLIGILVREGVLWRLTVRRSCPALLRGACRLQIPDDAGYMGLILGLSFAFPVASVTRNTTVTPFSQWCRLAEHIPAELVYLPTFVCGLMAALVDLSPHEALRAHQELHADDLDEEEQSLTQ